MIKWYLKSRISKDFQKSIAIILVQESLINIFVEIRSTLPYSLKMESGENIL